jgi:hypothetical protein
MKLKFLAGLVGAVALFLACGAANATTVSSATGAVNMLGNIPPSSSYSFTLTDHAQVDGTFGATGAVNTLNVALALVGSPAFITGSSGVLPAPGTPFTFHIGDLGPGDYILSFTTDLATEVFFSGSLTFSAPAVNPVPVPPAVLMLLTAIGGLGLLGWRRRGTLAA